jgi:TolB-like protein
MRTLEIHNSSRDLRHGLATLICGGLVIAALSACQDPSTPSERPTIAVLPIGSADTREETRDLADHLTKRLRTILSSRPEVRVIESPSAMNVLLTGMDISEKAGALGADHLLTGTLGQGEGRLQLMLQLFDKHGEELWTESFQSPLLYQSQLQEWVLDALWPQLPLEPQALEAARAFVANCHYPDDAMAILTLARTGRRGGGPASLAMVATADIEAGLLHLAQSQFYFGQLESGRSGVRPPVVRIIPTLNCCACSTQANCSSTSTMRPGTSNATPIPRTSTWRLQTCTTRRDQVAGPGPMHGKPRFWIR